MSDTLSRRRFLFYGGATLAGVTLGEFGRRHLAHADEQASMWREATTERWAVSVCRECPAACGLRVRVVNDLPVKLEGNPKCPIARGRLCAKGQAAVEALFDPDRLVGPARRVGARGEGRWERIPWETATGLLAARLRDEMGHSGGILAVAAEERGPVADAWAQFWTTAGARLASTPTATASDMRGRLQAISGTGADPLFDVEHATYVLSVGAPLVEDWLSSPVWAQRAYGRFRRGGGRSRGRLVQVDGRRSMTARKADEWIVVDADRQPALIYGLMAVLLRENRIDRSAFEGLAGNLDELERSIVARFAPDDVAAATGVPVVTILRLARDLVATARPLVIAGADADPALVDAMLALNGFIGAFDRPGGILAALPPIESATDTAAAAPATAAPRLVVLRDSAALRTRSIVASTEAALKQAEFVVSFSPFLDESSEHADLLMPMHTALESWHAVVPAPSVPGQAIALAPPVVSPHFDTRDLIAVLQALAGSVGGALPAACPWKSAEDLVTNTVGRLGNLRRGGPYTSSYESDWIQQLERGGWWTSPVSSRDEFATAALAAGGWADPFFEPGQIRRSLRDQGGFKFVLPPVTALGEPAGVTTHPATFPLKLRAFTPAVVNVLGSPNQPVLFELLGQPEGAPWCRWIELGPETARAAGLAAGARARVESANGFVEASVVLVDSMPADVAALSFVPSVPHGGRWARLVTGDARALWPAGVNPTTIVAVRIRPA